MYDMLWKASVIDLKYATKCVYSIAKYLYSANLIIRKTGLVHENVIVQASHQFLEKHKSA